MSRVVRHEWRKGSVDAPDAYFVGANIALDGQIVTVSNLAGDVVASYELDAPVDRVLGSVTAFVGGRPLTITKGCGCSNVQFQYTPKGHA